MADIEIDETEIYETVVVDKALSMAPGTVDVTPDMIEAAAPKSADEMLTLSPGIRVVQHGAEGKGHQIFMMGFDAAHGSDVEGRLGTISLNERSHVHGQGYLDLYGIIPEVVSHMTIAKGPYLPWQGDFGVAGTIQFELGVDDSLRPGFLFTDVTHRGRIRQVAVLAPKAGSEEDFAALSLLYDYGFGPDREAFGGTLLAQYRIDLKNKHALTTLVSLQSARFESPETLRFSDVQSGKKTFWSSYGPAGEGLSDRVLLNTTYQYEGEQATLDISVFGMMRNFRLDENFTGNLLYPEEGDLRRQAQQGGGGGVEADGDLRLSTSIPLRLQGGLGWRLDGLSQSEKQLDGSGTPFLENRRVRAVHQELFAFAALRLVAFHKLTLLPSFRVAAVHISAENKERFDHTLQAVPLPRVSMRLDIANWLALFAAYGRGYRSPEARALLTGSTLEIEDERLAQYTGGAPDITVIDSVSIGASFTYKQWLTCHLTGFASWLEKEMIFDHVSNLNVAMDGTRRFGGTAEVKFSPFEWLQFNGDITATDARFNRSKNPVPGVPIWLGRLNADIGKQLGPGGSFLASFLGKRPLAHGASVGSEINLQVGARWRFKRALVRLMVENLTHSQHMEGAYHFASHFDQTENRSVLPVIHYAAGAPITLRMMATIYL